MDFHCQYYRRRISLSFTEKLPSRAGKKNLSAQFPARNLLLCAPQNDAAEPLRPQQRPLKSCPHCSRCAAKNQTTHVRTNRSAKLHRLLHPSRACGTQLCRCPEQAWNLRALPRLRNATLPVVPCRPIPSPAYGFADAKRHRPASSIRPAQAAVSAPPSATIRPRLPPDVAHSPVRRSTRAAPPVLDGRASL